MVRWLMIAEPSQGRTSTPCWTTRPCAAGRTAPEPEPPCPRSTRASEEQRGAPRGAGGAADQPGSAVTLGTIKVPKNLKMLKKRLPRPPTRVTTRRLPRSAPPPPSAGEGGENGGGAGARFAAAAAKRRRAGTTDRERTFKEPNVVEVKAANELKAAQAPAVPAARARNALAPRARARALGGGDVAPSRAVALREARMGKQSGDAKPAGFRHGIARPSAKVVVDVADAAAAPTRQPREQPGQRVPAALGGGVRENQVVNSGNSEPQERRNAAPIPRAARERARPPGRARAERERASGIREMRAEMHRERAGAHPSHVAANGRQGGENEKKSASEYAAAPSRIVAAHLGQRRRGGAARPEFGSGYAPAAPLPGGRAAGLAGLGRRRPAPRGRGAKAMRRTRERRARTARWRRGDARERKATCRVE